MSKQLNNNNQGLSPTARGVIARTVDAFKMSRAIAAAKKAPHLPYGDFADSLGAEAMVPHVEMETASV